MVVLFSEGVSGSAECELAIDEAASTVSLTPNVCVVPEVPVAVQEGEESFQEFLDNLSGEESAARHFVLEGEADDNDSFVDIMSGMTAVGDVESGAGLLRMRWHVRICQWRLFQRVLSYIVFFSSYCL